VRKKTNTMLILKTNFVIKLMFSLIIICSSCMLYADDESVDNKSIQTFREAKLIEVMLLPEQASRINVAPALNVLAYIAHQSRPSQQAKP